MKTLLVVLCAILLGSEAFAHKEKNGEATSAVTTTCDASEIAKDLREILHYIWSTVWVAIKESLDIGRTLVFCASPMLSWLCKTGDWEERVEADYSLIQTAVSDLYYQVPVLWKEVVEGVESCF